MILRSPSSKVSESGFLALPSTSNIPCIVKDRTITHKAPYFQKIETSKRIVCSCNDERVCVSDGFHFGTSRFVSFASNHHAWNVRIKDPNLCMGLFEELEKL